MAGGDDEAARHEVTALGAAIGLDGLLRRYLFGEVRHDYGMRHGVQCDELPQHAVSLVLGFALR